MLRTLLMASCCLLVNAGSVYARNAADVAGGGNAADNQAGLDDIIVTARRSAENNQKVPIAVTAYSGEDLVQRNITGVTDLGRQTPSVAFTTSVYGALGARVSMRGQQAQDLTLVLTPSVGVYIDDIYQGTSATLSALGVQDAAAVEVLKGPQGTLYGRNTTGGAIKIGTVLPDYEDPTGGGMMGIGNFGGRRLYLNVSVPLVTDVAALRVSGNYDALSGYGRDTLNATRLGGYHKKSVRGTLALKPGEDLQIILRGDVLDADANGPPAQISAVIPGSFIVQEAALERGLPLNASGLAAAYDYVRSFLNPRNFDRQYTYPNTQYVKQQTVSGTLIWDATDNLTLKNISAFQHARTGASCDVDETPVSVTNGSACDFQRYDQFTQEIQASGTLLDRLSYNIGYYYYHLSGKEVGEVPVLPLIFGFLPLRNQYVIKDTSNSGYANLKYKILRNVNITGGVRYTSEKIGLDISNSLNIGGSNLVCNMPVNIQIGGQCLAHFDNSFTNWSFTGGVDWSIVETVLAYASVSRGFKAGGVNTRGSAIGGFSPFRPEVATNYELGLKSEFWNRRVRFNAAVFKTNYDDIQRSVITNGPNGDPTTEVRNAASAKIKGAEVELTVRPIPQITLAANGSYVHPKYDTYIEPATGRDLSGNAFAGVPKWQGSLNLSYYVPTPLGDLTTTVGVSYQSKVNFAPDTNQGPVLGYPNGTAEATSQPGYTLVDGRMSLAVSDQVTIALWVKNLTDKRYFAEGQDQTAGLGFANLYPGAPRTYGLEASVRF